MKKIPCGNVRRARAAAFAALAALAVVALPGAGARAAGAPTYDIDANCAALAEAAESPAMKAGCLRDENEALKALRGANVPADLMARCRAESDEQNSYVLLWGCVRDSQAGAEVDQSPAP